MLEVRYWTLLRNFIFVKKVKLRSFEEVSRFNKTLRSFEKNLQPLSVNF